MTILLLEKLLLIVSKPSTQGFDLVVAPTISELFA
jgi:hypothetical protein